MINYLRPAVADYGKAIGRWWSLLLIAVHEFIGLSHGGPIEAIFDGLSTVPVIWLLGPAGWPYMRRRAWRHRRMLSDEIAPLQRGGGWLAVGMMLGVTVLLVGVTTLYYLLGWTPVAPWWWLAVEAVWLLVALGLIELWLMYALTLDIRHMRLTAAAAPHQRSVRFLRTIEGRPLQPGDFVPAIYR